MKKFQWPAGIFILLTVMILPVFDAAPAHAIQIIVNKNLSETSLNADDVKNIYTGKKTRWSDNDNIVVAVLTDKDIHEKFLNAFVGRSSNQFTTLWKQMMFTGKGKLPKKFDSVSDMVDFVSKTEGAIGYITDGGGDGVKVVLSK